ncbi:MAG: hypothetical protein P8074_22090 [Anaerolineales bacterium]
MLNDMLLREMSAVAGRSILELGAGGLRLPIVPRRLSKYERLLSEAGFTWDKSDVYVTEKVLREKPGLRRLGNKPLALILRCQRI